MSYPDDGGRLERLSRKHLGIVTTLRTEIHDIRSAVKEECGRLSGLRFTSYKDAIEWLKNYNDMRAEKKTP